MKRSRRRRSQRSGQVAAAETRAPLNMDALADVLTAEIDRTAYRHRVETFLASREAGATLTLDALRKGIRLEAVVDVSANVAEYADAALEIIKEAYRPKLDCKVDCWYCCCKPGVLASLPELLRI